MSIPEPPPVPAPDGQPLMGLSEIGRYLGVTRQRARVVAELAAFPAPLARLSTGPVFDTGEVRRFAATWERRAGRPTNAATAPAPG